jgi:hypothetical protein
LRRSVDLERSVAYGSTRTADAEVAAMAGSSRIEQVVEVVKTLSDEDLNHLAKVVRRERKQRGLKESRGGKANQGEEDDEG